MSAEAKSPQRLNSYGVVDSPERILQAMQNGAEITVGGKFFPLHVETQVAMKLANHANYAILHNSPTLPGYQEAAIPIEIFDDMFSNDLVDLDCVNYETGEAHYRLPFSEMIEALNPRNKAGDQVIVEASEQSLAAKYNGQTGEVTGFWGEGWICITVNGVGLRVRPDEVRPAEATNEQRETA